jgi:hypothetical protein
MGGFTYEMEVFECEMGGFECEIDKNRLKKGNSPIKMTIYP